MSVIERIAGAYGSRISAEATLDILLSFFVTKALEKHTMNKAALAVAYIIVFLLSDTGSDIAGQLLGVDGNVETL